MIEYIGCESGDWYVIIINGEVALEGYSIKAVDLLNYLAEYDLLQLNYKERIISDQDIEEGNYYD